ncbi:MAG: KH domain-containing protein [Bacilli bacterium]|jgi:predicted RNA-binding protein YlqC (UPF0109 family)|nr:KH domain-containing protein [Bacilli bacterium]
MDLAELTSYLVKNLVREPEMVSVKQFDDEEDLITIQVLVSSDDMGTVIGAGGKIANSIRTIVQASASIHYQKKVKINIDSF